MKPFVRHLTVLALLCVCAALLFSFTASAETERNVVYISDAGTGDGSSPQSPLGNAAEYYVWSQTAYESSAINRAIAKLAANGKGGTIVVVGPVSVLWGWQTEANAAAASDFSFSPTQLSPSICISFTSYYGGVDYRKTNGAAIVLEKTAAQNLSLEMKCRTVWNSILFRMNYTSDAKVSPTGGIFACCCNETVIGHDVDTEVYRAGTKIEPTPANANYFFNLAGGHRFANQKGSANLTVNSGHWQSVTGGPVGLATQSDSYGHLNGGVSLTIGGNAVVLQDIDGGSYNFGGCVSGNVVVSIKGGTINGKLIVGGDGGFTGNVSTSTLKVTGGDFSGCTNIYPYGRSIKHYNAPAQTVLDCRGATPELASQIIALASDQTKNLVAPFSKIYSPVVFIKDGGTGDGLTPDSPLAAVDYGDENNPHFNSVLYRAANLYTGSDGVIVLVGEVRLDVSNTKGTEGAATKDMFLPDHPLSHLTITSVWDGVDYRQISGAKLVLQTPGELISGGPMTIENLTICTMPNETQAGANRGIFGKGFDLTIGEGVECVPLNIDGTPVASPASNLYPSVYGGHRYSNVTADRDFSVIIRSGTYYRAAGGNKGVASTASNIWGRMTGETHITIDGTATILNGLYATSDHANSFQFGDAYITIKGGTVQNAIYMCTAGGFGGRNYTSTLTITGGTVSVTTLQARPGTLTSDPYVKARYMPASVVLDLSEAPAAICSALASKASNFDVVYMPVKSVSAATASVISCRTSYREGEYFDPQGITARLTAYSRYFNAPYSSSVAGFSFVPDLSLPLGTETEYVEAYYGTKLIATIPIAVSPSPVIRMEGAMIRLAGEKQSLRFVATIDNPLKETLTGYGIVYNASEFFNEDSFDIFDGKKIDCTGTRLYKQPNGFTFGGTIENIPLEEYSLSYTAFAYYTYVDGGEEVTVLSNAITRSVESVANAAVVSGKESSAAVGKLNDNVLKALSEGWKSSYDAEEFNARVDKIIDKLYEMANVTWVSPTNIDFRESSSFTGGLVYYEGATYTGIPYVAGQNSYCGYTQWNSLYPDGATYTGEIGWHTLLGSMCSSGMVRGYQSVIRLPYGQIHDMLTFGSAPLIGQLDIPESEYLRTRDIVNSNLNLDASNDDGKAQRIYENYAQARRGDYLVSTWVTSAGEALGHIRMVDRTSPVWNSDGTINGTSSKMYSYEQCSTMTETKNDAGDVVKRTTWRMQKEFTYSELCNKTLTSTGSAKYLVVRPVVHTSTYYEEPSLVLENRNTPANIASGLRGVAKSNYYVYEAHLVITDKATGNTVVSLSDYPYCRYYLDVGMMDPDDLVGSLASGNYHYSLSILYAEETASLEFDFQK